MTYEQQTAANATNKKRPSAAKLKQVGDSLIRESDGAGQSLSRSESASSAAEFLSGNEIANKLFANAPEDFLESKTVAELVEIAKLGSKCLAELGGSSQKVIIHHGERGECSWFMIALGDRPFIVNTINECAEQLDCGIYALLHPIFTLNISRVSLCYLEVTGLSKGQDALLAGRLTDCLLDLILVTDDFPSMLVTTETLARLYDNNHYSIALPSTERRECSDFLKWLSDGGFVFLGHVRWCADPGESGNYTAGSAVGIVRTTFSYGQKLAQELQDDLSLLEASEHPVIVTKLHTESTVHRKSKLIHILVEEPSTTGKAALAHSFVGLLTSKAVSQEASSVPLIRQKLRKLLEIEEVVERSHDYKYIVDIIDRMPKEELLQLSVDELQQIVKTIIDIRNRNEMRVALRYDASQRGISVLVLLPPARFNPYLRPRLQEYLETTFGATPGSSEYHLAVSNKPPVRFNFYVPLPANAQRVVNLARIENEVAALSKTWTENLEEFIHESKKFPNPDEVLAKYGSAFGEDYQALNTVEECVNDISLMECLMSAAPLQITAVRAQDSAALDALTLVMYSHGAEITISRAFPILEHAGFEVINERCSRVSPAAAPVVYIHRFLVRPHKTFTPLSTDDFQKFVAPGLTEIFLGNADNDVLNSLLMNAKLDLRQVSLLRAYCRVLWQVNKFAAAQTIFETFAQHPKLTAEFWHLFEIRFNPALHLSLEERNIRFADLLRSFREELRVVSNITSDRILRGLSTLLENTVRTNYYTGATTLALKLHSEKIEIMPNPRPLFEIFVCSRIMEGVHLRSGLVSRGGIRISDRHDDFRVEVLGLMKTQRVKNALIVPQGSKGGLIVRRSALDAEADPNIVTVDAYKDYIRGLLSVTDNRLNGEVVRSAQMVAYDGEDPYLVVAADKGTASFSDIANKIAVEEFNFWLGDAFASGGSNGYDHKRHGITARGAWEAVKRHFEDLGVNARKDYFTVIGIGDLSGDVFGNGLVQDYPLKLIAAFNHKHIFIDPDPDPIQSLQERRRMFALPRSEWKDYNAALLSRGGGIFGRFDKQIQITAEMRVALSLPASAPDCMDGEMLISNILRAKADLLWNGGIGTYVKSRDESNADVNDGTNDPVRVNADELRVRVVGEGGNLGFTQRGRIDFARMGGFINTDAIDNSGGVDLSDHEVNIKILLSDTVREGRLSLSERDKLLAQIAPNVVQAVLEHNRNQALALALGARRSRNNIEYFHALIRDISKMGYIDRNLENLPDDDEISERASKKEGLTRPELAVCLAAVKMWLKDVIRSSSLIDDGVLRSYLMEYFPEMLRERFAAEIAQHPLAPHIIASECVNRLVDAVGITYIHRTSSIYSVPFVNVVRSALAAKELFGMRGIRSALSASLENIESKSLFNFRFELSRAMQEATSWFVRFHPQAASVSQLSEVYRQSFATLLDRVDEWLVGEEREFYLIRFEKFLSCGFSDRVARSLAIFPRVITILEILWSSSISGKDVRNVAFVYSHVMEELQIGSILKLEGIIEPQNKWEHELRINCYEEIRRNTSLIVLQLLERGVTHGVDVLSLLRSSPSHAQIIGTIQEITQKFPGVAALSAVTKQLRMYQVQT